MNQEDKEIIDKLVAGGLIGAALGALATENTKGATIGALAGAAILGSYHAIERAKKSSIPLMMVEDDKLYEVSKDGQKKFIKNVPPRVKVPSKMILK